MSLSNFIKKIDNHECESLPLAKLSQKSVIQFTDREDVFLEIYKMFNGYDLELTISPKTSNLLQSCECAACGRTKLISLDEQEQLMITLIKELVETYKVNILGCFEVYKDKIHLHSHMVINNVNDKKRTKIRKHIQNYYKIHNNIVVNLKGILSYDKYGEYMVKDSYGEYFYCTENKFRNIEDIEKEIIEKEQKEMELNKLKEESIYNDPIEWHKYTCEHTNCPICKWIGQCENDSQSHSDHDHFYNECV